MQLTPKKVELPSHRQKMGRSRDRLLGVDVKIPPQVTNAEDSFTYQPPKISTSSNVRSYPKLHNTKPDDKKKTLMQKQVKPLTVLGSPIEKSGDVFVANFVASVFFIMGAYILFPFCLVIFGYLAASSNPFFVLAYVLVALFFWVWYFRKFFKCVAKCWQIVRKAIDEAISTDVKPPQKNVSAMTEQNAPKNADAIADAKSYFQQRIANMSPEGVMRYKQKVSSTRYIVMIALGIQALRSFFAMHIVGAVFCGILAAIAWNIAQSMLREIDKQSGLKNNRQ